MNAKECFLRLFFSMTLASLAVTAAEAAVNPTLDQFKGVTINTPTTKAVSYSFTIKPSTTVNANTTINIQPNAAHIVQFDNLGTATTANGEELLIRTVDVVNDARALGPDGAWSFVRLMKEMMPNPNGDVETFIRNWLATWNANQQINGFTVEARNNPTVSECGFLVPPPCQAFTQVTNTGDILANWPKNSDGSLDLSQAPFRLLAIVNRLDKNTVDSQNRVTSAGEGRFVFGVLNQNGNLPANFQFTVIFEYDLPASNVVQRNEWINEWHDLGLASTTIFGANAISTADYLSRLQTLTDRFTSRNSKPGNTNGTGSALNQLRTNEVALTNTGTWELREFHITPVGLQEVTVKQTPDANIPVATLNAYMRSHRDEILAGTFDIPATFNGTPFLAGSALNDQQIIGDNTADVAPQRHIVALNSCMGCHGSETKGDQSVALAFLQIRPRNAGNASSLNRFLTGIDVIDPVDSNITRHFNDLDGRSCVMTNLITGGTTSCADRFERVVSGGSASRFSSFSAMSTESTSAEGAAPSGENVLRRTRSD